MSTVDLGRVRQLVEALRASPPAEWAALLERGCAGDRALQREVEELLAAERTAGQFLEPALELAPAERAPIQAILPGQRIGGYLLVRPIGSGGMGMVWEALQDEPRRRVALKTLRAGDLAPERVRRFRRESEILARLRHPGIAQVFAAGLHQPGPDLPAVPWYAMEHVEDARTIVEHARQQGLDLDGRLAQFLALADAVQHGHERGVIHRDLKPANVLVGADGCVKVIDFGVARLVDSQDGDSLATEPGRVIGTLQYMAPEQLFGANDSADVRCDVYALGALLYELAVGAPPRDLSGLSLPEAARVLAERPVPRPRQRSPGLPRDLEAIVLRAMDPDRGRRYASVAALAQDLERFRAGEPIEARPPSALRQLRLLGRRHKLLALSLSIAALALVAATAVSLGFAFRAGRAEIDALAQRDLARFREYTANLAAAYGALRGLDAPAARQRLQSAPRELRGFEWWVLANRLDRSRWSVTLEGDASYALDWHPDGARVFLATVDGGVEVRERRQGALLARLEGDGVLSTALAVSPDGSRLAQGLRDGRLRLLRSEPLQIEREWSAHRDQSTAVDFAPDGAALVSAGYQGDVQRWDLEGRALGAPFQVHSPVSALEFAPDGRRLAVGTTSPGAVLVWALDPPGGELRLEGHSGSVSDVAFSADGACIASAGHDGLACVWDARSGQRLQTLAGHRGLVWSLAFDGSERLITAGWDGTLRTWDVASGRELQALAGHQGDVLAVASAPDGSAFVASDASGQLKLWNREPGAGEIVTLDPRWACRLRFWPDGQGLLCLHGEVADRLSAPGPGARGVRFDPSSWSCGALRGDGAVALGDTRGRIAIFPVGSTRSEHRFQAHDSGLADLAWSHDGTRVVSLAFDGRLSLHGEQSLLLASAELGANAAPRLALAPQGARIAGARADGSLALWDAESGELSELGSCGAAVRTLRFTGSDRQLALGLADGRILLWDCEAGAPSAVLEGHRDEVLDLDVAPDLSRLVSSSADRSVRLWELPSGREVATFGDHAHIVHAVAFSPDGAWLVSGSSDGTLRWWRAGGPAERAVRELFAQLGTARAVRAALAREPALSAAQRAEALLLAAELPDEPAELARRAWKAARRPASSREVLRRAQAEAQAALEQEPELALARLALGAARLRLGDARGALEMLRGLRGAEHECLRAKALCALALAVDGRLDEARLELDLLLAQSAGRPADRITSALFSEARAALGR